MINILDSQVFYYDADKRQVTVYRDYSDASKYYVIPVPTYALDTAGLPMFSFNEFSQGDSTSATCSFTVELAVSPAALQTVRDHLPTAALGQLDWQTATVYFDYKLADQKPRTATATPSLFGGNQATFVIPLPTRADVEYFKGEFGPGGAATTTFVLRYDVTTLTKLPVVDATVSYDSTTALEYEKTVQIGRNVWGQETSRRTTIQEYLKQSGAGKTTIDWVSSTRRPRPSSGSTTGRSKRSKVW